MKLHDLVLIRNLLQTALNLDDIKTAIENNKTNLHRVITHANDHYSQKIIDLVNDHDQIFQHALADQKKIQTIIDEVNQNIEELTRKFFTENYQTECYTRSVNFIRNVKVLNMADQSAEILQNRIYYYNSWKYPALEIACRDGVWTKSLIGFDPLYIADDFDEFLHNASSQFTPEYQNRLRKYSIKDFNISGLPTNQFGFIFSFNYFNYLSLDTIKQYLIKSMDWLRPGGTILFTYNNADLSDSAGMTEGYFMTYVPKSMLVPLAESLGYEVTECFDFIPSTSWIELKKPGVLKTVKAHQALGEIKYY